MLALFLAAACSKDEAKASCTAVYSGHYGRLLIRASEDTSEAWRRAGYHSPAAWAHARAKASADDEERSGLCR